MIFIFIFLTIRADWSTGTSVVYEMRLASQGHCVAKCLRSLCVGMLHEVPRTPVPWLCFSEAGLL